MTTDISELMRAIAELTNGDVNLHHLSDLHWSAASPLVGEYIGDSAHEALCKLYDAVVAEQARNTIDAVESIIATMESAS